MYSVVCLILAYLLTQHKDSIPLVYLVPLIIIFPFYYVNINLLFNTYYIASYLNAFSNEFSFKWERRNNYMRVHKLGKYKFTKFNLFSFSKTYRYKFLSYICLSIYIINSFTYEYNAKQIKNYENIFISLTNSLSIVTDVIKHGFYINTLYVFIGFCIFFILKFKIKDINFHEYMQMMVSDWKTINILQ